ncbi:MAG: hypothetical protein EOO10_00670 [Chitinophagaceae bacterium]|nr:MAG: hypothetical protein EOO10_00670 [Chitinophagaceae bacterium]
MEDDARAFLLKVVRSLSMALTWLFINMTLGIYNELMMFDDKPTTGNIIYYIWLVLSLAFLIRFLVRTWVPGKVKEAHDEADQR